VITPVIIIIIIIIIIINGKRGSAAMHPIVPSYSWDSDEKTEQSTKPKKYKGTATIPEDQEWKHQE
jgi:hypothetical protein